MSSRRLAARENIRPTLSLSTVSVGDSKQAYWVTALTALSFGTLMPLLGIRISVLVVFVAVLGIWLLVKAGADAIVIVLAVGLMALSYGFNNIGVAGVPAVLVGLIVATAVTVTAWTGAFSAKSMQVALISFCLLVVLAICRLLNDYSVYGMTAVRDSLYILDALAMLPAMALVYRRGFSLKALDRLAAVILIWYCTYPFKDFVQSVAPNVGIQYTTSLADYTFAGPMAAILFLHFSSRRTFLGALGSFASLVLLLVTQQKGAILAFLVVLLVRILFSSTISRQANRIRHLAAVLVVSLLIGFLALATVPIPGRLEQASFEAVVNQFAALTGDEDAVGYESVEKRKLWQPLVLQAVDEAPLGPLFGAGFGSDLVAGFTTATGAPVRKPHNDYLEAYGRTGVVGLGAFVAILGAGLSRTWLAWRLGIPGAFSLLSTQIVILVVAATQPTFAFSYGGVPYFAAAGVAHAMLTMRTNRMDDEAQTSSYSG